MLSDFGIGAEVLAGAEVLFASYTDENYEGDAFVLFTRDGKLWEVHGSHCSCYGLSESDYYGSSQTQWQPEEVTAEAILHRLDKGAWGTEARCADHIRAAIARATSKEAQGNG